MKRIQLARLCSSIGIDAIQTTNTLNEWRNVIGSRPVLGISASVVQSFSKIGPVVFEEFDEKQIETPSHCNNRRSSIHRYLYQFQLNQRLMSCLSPDKTERLLWFDLWPCFVFVICNISIAVSCVFLVLRNPVADLTYLKPPQK